MRVALGVTSDDSLSDVDEETLRRYHGHLSEKLRFPFEATASEETGPLESAEHDVEVIGLLDSEDYDRDECYGLICEVRDGRRKAQLSQGELVVTGEDENALFVKDYACWFWNHR